MNFFQGIRGFFKASATTELVVRLLSQTIPFNLTNFESFAKEGYSGNTTVFACIDEIAKTVAGVPWLLQQKRGGQLVNIDSHPLLDLLKRPNEFEGGHFFIQKMVAYLLIHGNSYIEQVGIPGKAPRELFVLRPDRVSVLPDARNMVGGYKYTAGGQSLTFEAFEILHIKTFAPLDDWYGISPISVAAQDIDSDNAAKKWNFNLLSNSARPAGAWSTDSTLSNDQYSRLKNQIKDKYTGALNAGRPLLLEAGMQWKQSALKPTEMDWLAGRKLSALQICQVFGVPPEIIGMPDSKTYASYQEARKSFYLETILPYMDRLRDDFNVWLTPSFGNDLVLSYDRNSIEALQENREKMWSRVSGATWMTINEKRKATGLDEVVGGDVILVQANQLPLSVVTANSGSNA